MIENETDSKTIKTIVLKNTCLKTVQEVPEKTLSKGKSDIKKKTPVFDQTKQKEK